MYQTVFIYFVFLIFMIPSLIVTLYALLIYKMISRIERRLRILIPPAIALSLAITLPAIVGIFQPFDPNSIAIKVFGYMFAFVYGTIIASAIITPFFILENRTSYGQRRYMILSFSAVLAVMFMRGFANAIGTPSPDVGLLGVVDYLSLLSLGKPLFHLLSALIPYIEIAFISALFYTALYGLILSFNRIKKGV
jgi:hypothetical protein